MNTGVTLGMYGGMLNGFGVDSMATVANLNKALSTDTGLVGGTPSHNPLIVESLEQSLKTLTYTEKNIKLWKMISKTPAYSTVEEYNRLESYGSEAGGFIGEGALPGTEDSVYKRVHSFVKFLGTTREITHPMTLVRTAHGNPEAIETQNGILWLLKKLEQALFWGDSTLAANGSEGVQFDGLNKLVTNNLDMKGKPLTDVAVSQASNIVVQNYGMTTDMFLPYQVLANFSEQYFPKERVIMPTDSGVQAGLVVNKFNTAGGTMEFQPDVFLQKTKELPIGSTGGNKAPTAPSTVTVAVTSGTEVGDFAKHSTASTPIYKYWVTAVTRDGESAPVKASSDYTLASGDEGKAVKISIANNSSQAVAPEYYNIYRSEANGSVGYLVKSVPCANNQAGQVNSVFDDGSTVANTYTAFMGEFTPEVLGFKQLAPMMKMELAQVAPVKRFMILLYGTPQVYNPRKLVKITNIKA